MTSGNEALKESEEEKQRDLTHQIDGLIHDLLASINLSTFFCVTVFLYS
jgi:hypothetical protein